MAAVRSLSLRAPERGARAPPCCWAFHPRCPRSSKHPAAAASRTEQIGPEGPEHAPPSPPLRSAHVEASCCRPFSVRAANSGGALGGSVLKAQVKPASQTPPAGSPCSASADAARWRGAEAAHLPPPLPPQLQPMPRLPPLPRGGSAGLLYRKPRRHARQRKPPTRGRNAVHHTVSALLCTRSRSIPPSLGRAQRGGPASEPRTRPGPSPLISAPSCPPAPRHSAAGSQP